MRLRSTWLSLSLAPVMFLAGCSDNSAPSTPPAETPAQPAAGETTSAPPAETPTDAAAPAAPAAPAAEAPPADGAAATESPATPPVAVLDPELEKLVEGLDVGNAKARIAELKVTFEQNPADSDAATNFVGIIEQVGMAQMQSGNTAVAHLAFLKAVALADQAGTAGAKIVPQLLNMVYYNGACATALQQKPEDALTLLEKAFAAGYSDVAQLQADADLESVRALPAFAEKLAGWQASAEAAAKELVKAELAAAESFPFNFALTDVAGNPISLESLKGKVCIVDVWGTWCPPCRAEIPSFIKLQEKFGAQGFQMVGLNEEQGATPEDKAKLVTDYIAGNGINYPCALITEEVMSQIPDFQGFPTTLFIDRSGKVRLKAVGLHEYAYLEGVVTTLLAEDAPAAAATTEPAPAAETTPAPAADAATPAAPEAKP